MWYILTTENYAYVETERNKKKNKGTKCSQLVNLGIRTHGQFFELLLQYLCMFRITSK